MFSSGQAPACCLRYGCTASAVGRGTRDVPDVPAGHEPGWAAAEPRATRTGWAAGVQRTSSTCPPSRTIRGAEPVHQIAADQLRVGIPFRAYLCDPVVADQAGVNVNPRGTPHRNAAAAIAAAVEHRQRGLPHAVVRVDSVQLEPLDHQIPHRHVLHLVQRDPHRHRRVGQGVGLRRTVRLHAEEDVLLKQTPLQRLQGCQIVPRADLAPPRRLAIQVQHLEGRPRGLETKQIAFHKRPGVGRHRLRSVQYGPVPVQFKRRIGPATLAGTLQRDRLPVRLAGVRDVHPVSLDGRRQGPPQRPIRPDVCAPYHRRTAVIPVVPKRVVHVDVPGPCGGRRGDWRPPHWRQSECRSEPTCERFSLERLLDAGNPLTTGFSRLPGPKRT